MSALQEYILKGDDVKRSFDANYLDILQKMYPDLHLRYLVDFIHKAQLSGADPRKNQIHLSTYYSNKLGHKVGVPVFSYHFFLNQANMTKEFEGITVSTTLEDVFDPISAETKKQLVSTAAIFRKGRKPVEFKARWNECFNPKNSIWKERPYQMLEKTAIANGLRWQYPETLSGMFIEEEIREDHYEEAEKILEIDTKHEKAIEAVKEDANILDNAKNIKDIAHCIEAIKLLAKKITKGMKSDRKVEWMKTELEVDKFDELGKKSIEELREIIKKLETALENPIVV